MKRRSGLKPFREDLVLLFCAILICALILVVVDLPQGSPDWYSDLFRGSGSGAPQDSGDQEPGTTPAPAEETLIETTGYTSEDQSSEEPFGIDDANTTEVHAILTWQDDYGDNDQFSLGLEYEGESVDTVSGTTGTLELRYTSVAVGEYSIVITAMDCPGQFTNVPVDRDDGNDWSLTVIVTRMVPQDEEVG
jgi:hypothetical protein